MGVDDNIKMRNQMFEISCADENTIFVLTHLSHNGKLTHDQLEKVAADKGFLAAYDGIEVEF